MKVAFWSNTRGQNGVTSNMACVMVLLTLLNKKKIICMENHYHISNLENMFFGNINYNRIRETNYYFNKIGLDEILKVIQSTYKPDSKQMILNSTISLLDESIYYIPHCHITNMEFLEYELNRLYSPLMKSLESFSDAVFIDTVGSERLSSKKILHEADLVVVNLCQNPFVLSNFFQNYSSIKDKAVYLIGNYNKNSRYQLKLIMQKYGIPADKTAVIPYNIDFSDAISQGRLISFLTENYYADKRDENYYFMKHAKRAARILLKEMNQIKINSIGEEGELTHVPI